MTPYAKLVYITVKHSPLLPRRLVDLIEALDNVPESRKQQVMELVQRVLIRESPDDSPDQLFECVEEKSPRDHRCGKDAEYFDIRYHGGSFND